MVLLTFCTIPYSAASLRVHQQYFGTAKTCFGIKVFTHLTSTDIITVFLSDEKIHIDIYIELNPSSSCCMAKFYLLNCDKFYYYFRARHKQVRYEPECDKLHFKRRLVTNMSSKENKVVTKNKDVQGGKYLPLASICFAIL